MPDFVRSRSLKRQEAKMNLKELFPFKVHPFTLNICQVFIVLVKAKQYALVLVLLI